MREAATPNSQVALAGRKAAGTLTWSAPALMLFARSILAIAAQGLVAAVYAIQGSTTPWRDAGAWLPVYAILIDGGCLGLLWWLARREGIGLRDLIGFDRKRLGRDILFGVALIPPSLLLILGGNAAASLLVYGSPHAPQVLGALPLAPALYAVLVFPLVWGIVEQTSYNGYLVPRIQALSGSTGRAVAVVAFVWSFQHAVMPLTFDPAFMLYRTLSPLAFSTFIILVYLRIRRIIPLATAHWLMDGAAAFIGTLWPLLR
jgi:hypothetical protein